MENGILTAVTAMPWATLWRSQVGRNRSLPTAKCALQVTAAPQATRMTSWEILRQNVSHLCIPDLQECEIINAVLSCQFWDYVAIDKE